MKKKTIIWIIAAVIIAAATIIYFTLFRKKATPVSIVTVHLTKGYISKSITATGTLQPVDTVTVGAQVSGMVKSIFADFNSLVKKGQLLAQVEPSIIKAQSEEVRANLANANSNLNYQQINLQRQTKLYKLGAISQADYQLAGSQFKTAKAAVDNMAAQLKISLQTLSYTNIYSPINGTVLNRNVSVGQTIASSFSAPTLFVIAKDLTKMQVSAAVDEADIGGVLVGQHVSFTVDAFPDNIFRGTVREILLRAAVSSNVVTYTTLINVDNNDLKLKPGMTASINIYSEEDSNAMLIPARALTFTPDTVLLKKFIIIRARRNSLSKTKEKKATTDSADIVKQTAIDSYVWVKTGDTLTQRLIRTSLDDDTNVKVLSGLWPNDEVVTSATAATAADATTSTQQSPFMPTMGRKKTTGTVQKK
jgi:HlyD family secretion protein